MSATLMRREVWFEGERARPLPDDVAPDIFLFVRAAAAGWPFYFVNKPLMIYRLHQDQTSRSDEYWDFVVAAWEQFKFQDSQCERLRRKQLAEAYIGRAMMRLTSRDGRGARADLLRARGAANSVRRGRRIALTALTHQPAVFPAARRLHRRLAQLTR
jgi:hypothetical protein